MQVNVFAGYTKQITVPGLVLQDSWNVTSSYLAHVQNVKSTVHKKISSLKLNTVYRITYEVFDYVSCSVYLKVGTQEGPVRTAPGIYTEYYTINTDADRTLTFVSDGILKIRGITYEEKQFTTTNIPFTDTTKFENKSWTLSYSFYSNSWISWHSYMPLYYIHNQDNFYSFIGDSRIHKHNIEGVFHKYYGISHPYIIEYVPQASLQTKTWEDLTFLTKARRWDTTKKQYNDERFITFNKILAYTDRGATGEQNMIVKDIMGQPQDWLFHQLTNTAGTVLLTRKERDWNMNELRDYVADPSLPIFSSAWADTQNFYFIDKVLNQSNIDLMKQWDNVEMLRDKFIVIRLKFDSFDNVNLIFNYSIETELTSSR
jgi:hypothetical protein